MVSHRSVMNRAHFLAANEPPSLPVSAAKVLPQMFRRWVLLGRPTKHRLFSSSAAVPFSRTQPLVPTLPVPPLPQTIAKYSKLTAAFLPDSQAQVRTSLMTHVLFTELYCSLSQDAAAAAERFMKVIPHFSFT
jgi:hypothetical protein